MEAAELNKQTNPMNHSTQLEKPAAWSVVFFFVLLAAIIFLPFFHPIYLRRVPTRWHRYYVWDSNWKKLLIGVLLSLGYFIYLLSLSIPTARSMFLFSLHSFVSLFALLSALFVTCTGLPVVKLPSVFVQASTPIQTLLYLVAKNVLFLAGGTLLCNFIGTLAASVLLFPSFISQNASRLDHLPTQRYLIIFFIVLVGNCGGVLSPLGDPPLYMGYTNGVRFLFTFEYLYKIFLVVNGYTLLMFALIDLTNALLKRRDQRKHEATENETELHEKLDAAVIPNEPMDSRYDLSPLTSAGSTCSWHGMHHLPFLLAVIVLVVLKGLNLPRAWPLYLQEALLISITLLCLLVDMIYNRQTPAAWYKRNYSTRMEPVVEVLVIFVGLLFTMSAPIAVLTNMNFDIGPKLLFFISGVFSALLDNAAVYISFAANAAAQYNITIDRTDIDESGSTVGFLYVFFKEHPADATVVIRALSAGSVLMGGCTLIGNAPNIVVAFMATRYTYRTHGNNVRRSGLEVQHIERIGFLRQMLVATTILTPVFLFVAFQML